MVWVWFDSIDGEQAELREIMHGTAMKPIMVWMALLLGGFQFEKKGDFYLGSVIIK